MPVQVTTDEKGKVLAVATIDMHKRAVVAGDGTRHEEKRGRGMASGSVRFV
jgi:hypothetical protein